jgi:hypothetical protein
MSVVFFHGWPVRPDTQANTPERSGKVTSFRADGAHTLQWRLAVLGGLGVRVIPWFKQILKVFVCGLAEHNGHILKVLWGKVN